jgi:prepilin-type N-terminal cleavage/methylation domain-containing protein
VPTRAFTLIELLVVIAIIAILIALVLPSLAGARENARAVVCLSNLRNIGIICRSYADDHKGLSPALGQPYTDIPNWALVVQNAARNDATTGNEAFTPRGVLVCPSAARVLGSGMTRTYGINATGLAGAPGDRANFDDAASPAHIRLDLVAFPSQTPLIFDTGIAVPPTGDAPPPTRTASVLDLRNPTHRDRRLARYHGSRRTFHFLSVDNSGGPSTPDREADPSNAAQPLPAGVRAMWLTPLP